MGAISIPNVNVRLFDLKQAKQLGTAQRPAPQGAEVRSVFQCSFFDVTHKSMQMQSKWRAEVQEVVITW